MDRGDRLTERFKGRAGPTCAGTPWNCYGLLVEG
jgi:hypothetical protein